MRILKTLALVTTALPLAAQESADDVATRLDADNRRMLWLAFGLYAAVLAVYLLWNESRLRKLEKRAAP